MADDDVRARVTEVFRDVFDNDSIVLNDKMTASDIEGWDSVAHIRLMLAIEEAFGVTFETAEISEIQNVGELLATVRQKMEA